MIVPEIEERRGEESCLEMLIMEDRDDMPLPSF